MKTIWNKGLKAEQRSEMKADFLAARPVRLRLIEILKEEIESIRSSTRSSNSYESPSWAYTQADSIGYERAMFKVISLLSDEKSSINEK